MFLHISAKRRQFGSSRKQQGDGKGKGNESEIERFFEALLEFVERYYPRTSTDTGWSGRDYDLKGKTKCALALVRMIVERWLGVLE